MSLGVGSDAEPDQKAELRALAHPLRLRLLSLLTGAAMTTAELARELGIAHASASYHLRQLLAAGKITIEREERIRGGVAKRYRYEVERDRDREPRGRDPGGSPTTEDHRLLFASLAAELQRRAARRSREPSNLTDAELWVAPAVWEEVRERVAAASVDLHRAARPAGTPGTIRVSATIALFPMQPDG